MPVVEIAALSDVRRTVLLTTVHNLHDTPNFLASPISTAARKTTEALEIIILSPFFNPPPEADSPGSHRISSSSRPDAQQLAQLGPDALGISRTAYWDDVQRLLTFVYVQATKVAQDMGRILLDIDVLLKGTAEPFPEQIVRDAERIFSVTPHDTQLPALPASIEQRRSEIIVLQPDEHPLHTPAPPPPPVDPSVPPLYPVVALGGTFDHLHAGHKILLSMGAWIAKQKLIVGITDDALLGKKEYKEVLEPLSVRTARTRAFLELFKPGVVYDLVPLNDVYGPTGWDPNVQALVVSKETLPGAASIAKRREELSLPALRTFVIDVISATESSVDAEDAALLKTAKMSSTYIREWIVKNQGNNCQQDGSAFMTVTYEDPRSREDFMGSQAD